MNKYLKIFLLISLIFSLSGCLDIEYKLNINSDGSEKVTAKIGGPSSIINKSADLVKDFESNGYKTTIATEGDKSYIVATKTVSKGNWFIPYFEKLSSAPLKFQPTYSNYVFVKVYKIKADYVLDKNLVSQSLSKIQDNEFLDDIRIPLRYAITVPGKVTKNNADEVNGNTLVWNYTVKANEKVDLELVSYEINYVAVIILLIVIFAIIIARLKRKQTKWATLDTEKLTNK